jgi:hypothetical protein
MDLVTVMVVWVVDSTDEVLEEADPRVLEAEDELDPVIPDTTDVVVTGTPIQEHADVIRDTTPAHCDT